MLVLVPKPRPLLVAAGFARTQMRVHPLSCSPGQSKCPSAKIGHQAPVSVVQAHHNVAARPYERYQSEKALTRLTCMVQDTIAENHIELALAKWQAEEIGLYKSHSIQSLLPPEAVGQAQRVEAKIHPNDPAAGHPEEVAQLACAATHLENRRIVTDGRVQRPRVLPLPRLLEQRPDRIVIVVVRKRRLFIECPHAFRDVASIIGAVMRPVELRNPIRNRKAMPAIPAE